MCASSEGSGCAEQPEPSLLGNAISTKQIISVMHWLNEAQIIRPLIQIWQSGETRVISVSLMDNQQ